jgi:dTMP kinase
MTAGPGLLLSFEGIEGSGKSTQAAQLESGLLGSGKEVLRVREPGGTPLSEAIRRLLLQEDGPAIGAWSELFLYVSARAQLVEEKIRPALEAGHVVLADRYAEASVAYQGGGRRLGVRRVRTLNRWATGGIRPARIYLFDLDPAVGMRRILESRGRDALDRLETEPLAFHRRVRRAYLRMARREPERFRVLDAALPSDRLHALIREDVQPLL